MTKLGEDLLEAMAEALAHARGEKSGVKVRRVEVRPSEVRRARERLGLSQDKFADAFGVSASAVRKWEQGQRAPKGAAKTLLRVIEREPRAVLRALAAGASPPRQGRSRRAHARH